MTLLELYKLKLYEYKKTGLRERPWKLLAMLLLSEKDKYGLVLDNFHEMKEDINIVVKFEKVEENPNTEAFISIIIILTIPISLVVLTYLKKQKKILKI